MPEPRRPRADWPGWLLLAMLALLPFGRASELPLLVAAITGLVWAIRGTIAWRAPGVRLALLLFLGYWLPELLSAVDAIEPGRASREVAADLRYLPLLLFAVHALREPDAQQFVQRGAAVILGLWLLDALLQAATGWSLGGPAEADRLSGIFGADDLKLGGVVAVLSPLLLWPLLRHRRELALVAFAAVLIVVLLAGARAAWIVLALVVVMLATRALPRRQALMALSVTAVLAVLGGLAAFHASDRFAERVERSSAALAGDEAALDHALSFRLPIWRAAWSMTLAHPVNGIGVRGFRHAYPSHAPADDRWRDFDEGQGAFHAHQWVLEVLSETGIAGLFCWVAAIAIALRAWWHADASRRVQALAPGIALVAMLFPLNTHYAFYSSVWGGLLFWLLALWLPAIASAAMPAARDD